MAVVAVTRPNAIVCGDEPLAPNPCPANPERLHNPSPQGYSAWHGWAEAMGKTHRLEVCTDEAHRATNTIYFTSRCVPLDQLPEAQTPLFHGDGPTEEGVETCDAFSCMT